MENTLDDLQFISSVDKDNQLGVVLNWSNMWKEIINADSEMNISFSNPINRLFISGMGGSGISGNLLKEWIETTAKIPVHILHDYSLPTYNCKHSALICISYSGDTEEVLSVLEKAITKDMPIIGITSGGKLQRELEENNLSTILLPEGYQPRFALPYMLGGVLRALHHLKLILMDFELTNQIFQVLQNLSLLYAKEKPFADNQAKKLALFLSEGLPVIIGASSGYSIAVRFRCQLNENCKLLALSESIPEQNHNGIVGLFGEEKPCFDPKIVLLQGFSQQARNKLREQFIIKRANYQQIPIWIIQADINDGFLISIIKALYITDIASIYLAILRKVDPSDIEPIDALKSEL